MKQQKQAAPSMERLERFLHSCLQIDYPLYMRNPRCGVKLDFEALDDAEAKTAAQNVLSSLLWEEGFWLCEYGSDSGTALQEKGFLCAPPLITEILPHKCTTLDPDWFSYDVEAISCNYVKKSDFSLDTYIQYAFRLDFLSNTILIIDEAQEFALHIYDRRGMDIVATDPGITERIRTDFRKYIMYFRGSPLYG